MSNPLFLSRVQARWNELKPSMIDTLPAAIDELAASLSLAQQNNFARWLTLDKKVWPNRVVTGSYQGEVDELKAWITKRIAWMDLQFNPKP